MSSSLEERRAERRRQRQLMKEDETTGTKSPDELHADVQERLARRRKERLDRISALASGDVTVNGDDDLERRRRERREARLRTSEDASDDYSSRRNRRRGTDEDITATPTEDDYSSSRSRRRRNWDDDETPTVNETPSVPDTSEEDAAAERRRRQREEEEEEARRQQEREEEEERRRQEESRRQREAEEEEERSREREARREEEERQRRVVEDGDSNGLSDLEHNTEDEDEDPDILAAEKNKLFIDEGQLLNRDSSTQQEERLDRVKQWNNENNVLSVGDSSSDQQRHGVGYKTINVELRSGSVKSNSENKNKVGSFVERSPSFKEREIGSLERSPSFKEREINNNKIRDKLSKFENFRESDGDASKVGKDKTPVLVSEKNEGLKGKLQKFEQEIKDQGRAAKEKTALTAGAKKEPTVFATPSQKVSAKLQKFEVAMKSQSATKSSTRNVQGELEKIGSSKDQRQALLGRWSNSETQINTTDQSTTPKRNILDRWKQKQESPKPAVKPPPERKEVFTKRLSGNTEFVAARYLEKASKSIEEPASPRLDLSDLKSPSFSTKDRTSTSSDRSTDNKKRISDTFENQSEFSIDLDAGNQSRPHVTEKWPAKESGAPTREMKPTVHSRGSSYDGSYEHSKESGASTREIRPSVHSRGSSYDGSYEHSRGSSLDASSERSGRLSQFEQEEEERLEEERQEEERQEKESRMAEEQKKKRGKRKGLGGLTPEKKKLLKDVHVEYTTDEEEEKIQVLSERLEPLPDDFDFLSTAELRKLCKKLHQTMAQIHQEVYDWEFKVGKQEQEITELTNKINDSKGKFVKPVLRKVNKTEAKFTKLSKVPEIREGFRETLRSTAEEGEEEEN